MHAPPSLLRNSLLLYGRMILVMAAALLLSRLLLAAMGVDGYGVYSLLWGIVTLLAFFESALTTTFQRYFGNSIGTSDSASLTADFGAAVICSILSAFALLVIGSCSGFFALPLLDIPDSYRPKAYSLLLLCLLAMAFRFARIPLLSILLSREQMGAYACVSIGEVALKLLVAAFLTRIPMESITLYCISLPIIDGLVASVLLLYCNKIPEIHFSFDIARSGVGRMLRFAGANSLGSGADIGVRQGCNIVVNLFFGVVINASVAVCSQARIAVTALTASVQTAVAPRIFSLYGAGRDVEMKNLIYHLSRLSFLLTAIIAVPLGICAHEILDLWLGTPPPWAPEMFTVMCIVCVIDSLSGPLWLLTVAHGRIWIYQMAVSCLMLLNVPTVAFAFWMGLHPVYLYGVEAVVLLCVLTVRVLFAIHYRLISGGNYLLNVILPLLAVGISGIAAASLCFLFTSYWRLLVAILLSWSGLLLAYKLFFLRSRSLTSLLRQDFDTVFP